MEVLLLDPASENVTRADCRGPYERNKNLGARNQEGNGHEQGTGSGGWSTFFQRRRTLVRPSVRNALERNDRH